MMFRPEVPMTSRKAVLVESGKLVVQSPPLRTASGPSRYCADPNGRDILATPEEIAAARCGDCKKLSILAARRAIDAGAKKVQLAMTVTDLPDEHVFIIVDGVGRDPAREVGMPCRLIDLFIAVTIWPLSDFGKVEDTVLLNSGTALTTSTATSVKETPMFMDEADLLDAWGTWGEDFSPETRAQGPVATGAPSPTLPAVAPHIAALASISPVPPVSVLPSASAPSSTAPAKGSRLATPVSSSVSSSAAPSGSSSSGTGVKGSFPVTGKTPVYESPSTSSRVVGSVGDASGATHAPIVQQQPGWVKTTTPDGRPGWVPFQGGSPRPVPAGKSVSQTVVFSDGSFRTYYGDNTYDRGVRGQPYPPGPISYDASTLPMGSRFSLLVIGANAYRLDNQTQQRYLLGQYLPDDTVLIGANVYHPRNDGSLEWIGPPKYGSNAQADENLAAMRAAAAQEAKMAEQTAKLAAKAEATETAVQAKNRAALAAAAASANLPISPHRAATPGIPAPVGATPTYILAAAGRPGLSPDDIAAISAEAAYEGAEAAIADSQAYMPDPVFDELDIFGDGDPTGGGLPPGYIDPRSY